MGTRSYESPFKAFGTVFLDTDPTEDRLSKSSLVVFTGGHDVDPSLYGEAPHRTTRSNIGRDIREAKVYHYCVKSRIPMVGICRGSQFLTVMNGGKLVQDITGHATGHRHEIKIIDAAGVSITEEVTSTHHQMMYPYTLPENDYKLLGFSVGLSKLYSGIPAADGELHQILSDTKTIEPEIVYYHRTRSLAFQYHPEMMSEDDAGFKITQNMIEYYLLQ